MSRRPDGAARVGSAQPRLPGHDARRSHLLDRPVAVPGGDLDRPNGVEEEIRLVAQPGRVEPGRLDAVVGGKAAHDDPLDTAVAEQLVELGGHGVAARRVTHREARVAVLPVHPLADSGALDAEVRMQLGAPCAADAVNGPDPAVLGEVRRRLGVPVLGVHHERLAGGRGPDLAVDDRHDGLALRDRQAARRIGEVVLEVDDHEGRSPVVALHPRTLPQVCRTGRWWLTTARWSVRRAPDTNSGGTWWVPPPRRRGA